jgi:hypothetical protein
MMKHRSGWEKTLDIKAEAKPQKHLFSLSRPP